MRVDCDQHRVRLSDDSARPRSQVSISEVEHVLGLVLKFVQQLVEANVTWGRVLRLGDTRLVQQGIGPITGHQRCVSQPREQLLAQRLSSLRVGRQEGCSRPSLRTPGSCLLSHQIGQDRRHHLRVGLDQAQEHFPIHIDHHRVPHC